MGRIRQIININGRTVLLTLLLVVSVGCDDGKGPPSEADTVEVNIVEDTVEDMPQGFNGGKCFICIDVAAAATRASAKWQKQRAKNKAANKKTPPLTEAEIAKEMLADFDRQAKKCDPGDTIKLQFLFHLNPKHVFGDEDQKAEFNPDGSVKIAAGMLEYDADDMIETVFAELKKRNESRIRKIYLTACGAWKHKKDLVRKAFSVPGVTHVIAPESEIELACGQIVGAGWNDADNTPRFGDYEVKIIVVEKTGGKLKAKVPKNPMGGKKKFVIDGNKIVDK